MKIFLSLILFYVAYRYLERDSLLRKVILVWTGITLAISALSIAFSILSVVAYFCIIGIIVVFIVKLVKRFIH